MRGALITGATGFVGSHLIEALSAAGAGRRLKALVRPHSDTALLERLAVERIVGDLADREALSRAVADVEVVFHLAGATTALNGAGYAKTNVEGTRALCNAVAGAAAPPSRLVYLSSYAACGPAVEGRARKIDDSPAPLTAYGRTKLEGERLVRGLTAQGVDVVVLRSPAVYGPRDRALLPFFRLVKLGIAPVLGGSERRLHVIFAPDLARALARAADAAPGIYAVAEPVAHRWRDLVAAIGRAMQKTPVEVPVPATLLYTAAHVSETLASLRRRAVLFNREKANEMLASAWVCELDAVSSLLAPQGATPLETGIAKTVEWYRSRGWL